MNRPWMPWYPGDFERDTRHLSPEKVGVYVRLINHYWSKGKLPKDEEELANIGGIDLIKWSTIRQSIADLFVIHLDGVWTHKRIESELAKALKISVERKLASNKALEAKGKRPRPNGHHLVDHKATQPQPYKESTSLTVCRDAPITPSIGFLATPIVRGIRGGTK